MKPKTTMMKLILAALSIASVSAAFVCDEDCAGELYAKLAELEAGNHGLEDLDYAYYAYILYQNVAAAGDFVVSDIFMASVGEACELGESWKRAEVVSCFEDADQDAVDAVKESFGTCDEDNENACTRIAGILANRFAPGSTLAGTFDSELEDADTAEAINIYTIFMAVVGSWTQLDQDCRDAIAEGAGYTVGDDVVDKISNSVDEIKTALASDACGGEAIAAVVTALVDDVDAAVTLAAKLNTEAGITDDDDAESSAAVLSFAAGLIAFML